MHFFFKVQNTVEYLNDLFLVNMIMLFCVSYSFALNSANQTLRALAKLTIHVVHLLLFLSSSFVAFN